MAEQAAVPTRQITLSDIYRDSPPSDAQLRRIVALLGLAGGAQRTRDVNSPQPDSRRLGA